MAKKVSNDFPFYDALYYFYKEFKGTIRRRYKDLTRKILDFNDKSVNPDAFLRKPQFEAFEMYVFLKEFFGNQQMCDLFSKWYYRKDEFEKRDNYNRDKYRNTLFDDCTKEIYSDVFDILKGQQQIYSNYIFALTMGVGKTYLIATCILYEFLLANKFPNDKEYCHNALVFAPDKTVLQSLKSIKTFDFSKVIPPMYSNFLNTNIKFHFLDDSLTTLDTIDDSDFNIIISNTQKIILKKVHKDKSAADKLFGQSNIDFSEFDDFTKELYSDLDLNKDDSEITTNQRFEKIIRLKQLGVYVDEAHHLFGTDLKSALSDSSKETSLRYTINEIARQLDKKASNLVACYNYTGTPYVENRVLPEVVYAYGLKEAISDGYLKQVNIHRFDNVKNKEFLRKTLTDFFERYNGEVYEGLKPKIAIFGSSIKEVIEEIKPIVEDILFDLGIDINTVLVNVGDSKYTKDNDINNFNNMDVIGTEGNNKQVILLVNKGREGWDCHSLFGVALFRSPKSNVFVLQSTMRCLRSITKLQQTAQVYLSKENYEILDNELKKNFNIDIKKVTDKTDNKQDYIINIIPPVKTLELKEIHKKYNLISNDKTNYFNFNINNINTEKYQSKEVVQYGIDTKNGVTTDIFISEDNRKFSKYTLVFEISKYLNVNPLKIEKLLNSTGCFDEIVSAVSKYNDIIYDELIPQIFNNLYHLEEETFTKNKKVPLIKYREGMDYFIFRCKDDMSISKNDAFLQKYSNKSFHVNRYCFDSYAEKELFLKLIQNDCVKEVYFTGMFTGFENGLSVEYIDPTSNTIRNYYPDILVFYKDGSVEVIEVKGDNKIDDEVVNAKAYFAIEMASKSKMLYNIYKSSDIVNGKIKIIEPSKRTNENYY